MAEDTYNNAQTPRTGVEQDHQGTGRSTPTAPGIDTHLLEHIVPNFKRIATSILLTQYSSSTDNGTDEHTSRRSEALGAYFQERVFVPAVTTVDTPSWRSLCRKILSMARHSSIISNAVAALSQLHFVRFSSPAGGHGGPHVTRNGQNLAEYLYIFARDSLSTGLDLLTRRPSQPFIVELLVALFLLTCFEVLAYFGMPP